MPKSKTRKRPAAAPAAPRTVERLDKATLGVLQAGLLLVQRSEDRINAAIREEVDTMDLLDLYEQHLNLRAGVLGLMTAYSQMTGLPDPRSAEIAGKVIS